MTQPTAEQIAEWDRRTMIHVTYGECQKLLQSGIFSLQGARTPLFQAAVVQLLICLNDLLQKAKNENRRIAFVEHVTVEHGVTDVTDLISKCRNAACHIGSPHSDFEFGKFRFNVAIGRGTLVQAGYAPHTHSEFDDDIAVFYGNFRLYLKRHVERALNELRVALNID